MLKRKKGNLAKKNWVIKISNHIIWYSRCKWRFVIKLKKVHGEKESAEQRKSTELSNLLQKLCADDICNIDEIGSFVQVRWMIP
jgi:hypothetical protein